MEEKQDQTPAMTATEELEREYGNDPMAMDIIAACRESGISDEEILGTLNFFY